MAYERLDKTYKDGAIWDGAAVTRIDDAIESKQDVMYDEMQGLVAFEEGTLSLVNSTTIQETSRTDRTRSEYVDLSTFTSATISGVYKFWIVLYDSDKNYLSIDITTHRSSITIEEIKEISENSAYIRFIGFNGSSLSSNVNPVEIQSSFSVYVNVLNNVPNIMETVNDTNREVLSLKSIVTSKLFGEQTDIPFYQGGWNGSTGELNTSTSRIHTDLFNTSSVASASCDSGYAIWYMTFDATYNVVQNNTGTSYKGYTNIDFTFASNEKYVRFVVINGKNNSTAITPTEDTGFTLLVDTLQEVITEEVVKATDGLSSNRHIGALGVPDYQLLTSQFSDGTWVGDEYLGFSSTSSDDLETTDPSTIWVYRFANGLDKGYTSSTRYYHKFGHCNTVDYSPINDCLIMGNGSGSYTLEGKIFIFPNFSSIITSDAHQTADDPLTLENTNAIVIDCTGYGLGTKFNVMWGEVNGANKHNIAYLATARLGASTSAPDGGDNGTIRKLLLGLGSTALTYGTLIEGTADGEFNGTFNILDTFTQEGTAYAQCNQGSCFYRGEIYSAVGHDGLWMWKMRLDNGKISYDEWKQYAYDDTGSILNTNVTSCSIHNGYLYIGALNMGTMAFRLP